MKLLLCKNCSDVVKMSQEIRWCNCGKVGGKYIDEINACYWGDEAILLGFANDTLVEAVKNQPEHGLGEQFVSFVIPKNCPTFVKCKRPRRKT
jgi:hypothetical protein